MVSHKQWESREISLWINNDEFFHELARQTRSPRELLEILEMIGFSEIVGIKPTVENLRESWEDANDY